MNQGQADPRKHPDITVDKSNPNQTHPIIMVVTVLMLITPCLEHAVQEVHGIPSCLVASLDSMHARLLVNHPGNNSCLVPLLVTRCDSKRPRVPEASLPLLKIAIFVLQRSTCQVIVVPSLKAPVMRHQARNSLFFPLHQRVHSLCDITCIDVIVTV